MNSQQSEIERYLNERAEHVQDSLDLPRRQGLTSAALSLGQEQLWFHSEAVEDKCLYNEPLTIIHKGPLDTSIFERCFQEVIRRHEIWRTSFSSLRGQPIQVVHPAGPSQLEVIDLRSHPLADRDKEALRIATSDCHSPFDLGTTPLLRAKLILLSDDEQRLYLTLHQIIFDGVSMYSVVLPEIEALYEAYSQNQSSPLPELPMQYSDFSLWQREKLTSQLDSQLDYWRKQLAAMPASLELPIDHPRRAHQTYRGTQVTFELDRPLSHALRDLSRREGVTLFHTLLAGYQILLYRYSGQDDIVVGTVTSTRKRSEFESMIGFFLNTLVLRTKLDGDPTFRDLLQRVREVTIGALSNDAVPIHHLLELAQSERDRSRNPLFQVMFVLEPPLPEPRPGWDIRQMDVDPGIARVDLYLEMDDRTEGLIGRVRYNRDLFEQETIQQFLDHWQVLLQSIVADPGMRISALPLLTERERSGMCENRNTVSPTNDFEEFPLQEIEQGIHHRFAKQVSRDPEKIAVIANDSNLTYSQLNGWSDHIAGSILPQGPELVALLLGHDAAMIAGILGVLKSGHAYVPLDPLHPVERLATILRDSRAKTLVTDSNHLDLARAFASEASLRIVNISDLKQVDFRDLEGLDSFDPSRLAYVLYTSGSTGQPKGILQNHRNVLHHVRAYTNALHINSQDNLTLLSAYGFDASVMDIYGALLNGATLCPIDLREVGFDGLRDRVVKHATTILHCTPTVLRQLAATLAPATSLPTIRLVVLGGEEAKAEDFEIYKCHFSDKCIFINGFGPTESTVTLQRFMDKSSALNRASVPIGSPVCDTEVLLLDQNGEPDQIFGEIAIRSAHTTLGYWNLPELNEKAFLPVIHGGQNRVYRTGDLGRSLPDGSLIYLGRKGSQVKIRGHRIELGEIEAALLRHPAVSSTAVTVQDNSGSNELVAYFTSHTAVPTTQELNRFLRQTLPGYMVPSSFVAVDQLFLLPNGKVDRARLQISATHESLSQVPAQITDSLELQIAELWKSVLKIDTVSATDDFFDLGGHSLLAVRLIYRMEREFGKRLSMASLFSAPTIEQLAAMIRDAEPTRDWITALQPVGTNIPFFSTGIHWSFRKLSEQLGKDRPFLALNVLECEQLPVPYRLEDIAARFANLMVERQPAGPYVLGGWCYDGLIAYEVAQQLQAQGHEIAMLVLFDVPNPAYYRNLSRATRIGLPIERLIYHSGKIARLGFSQLGPFVIERIRELQRKFKNLRWEVSYDLSQQTQRLNDIDRITRVAVASYEPKPFSGPIAFFLPTERPHRGHWNLALSWKGLTPNMKVYEVPGDHVTIFSGESLGYITRKIDQSIPADSTSCSQRKVFAAGD